MTAAVAAAVAAAAAAATAPSLTFVDGGLVSHAPTNIPNPEPEPEPEPNPNPLPANPDTFP